MHNEAVAHQAHRRGRRALAIVAAVGALSAVSVTPAVSPQTAAASPGTPVTKPPPTFTYIVPEGSYIEGIVVHGDQYYVTGVDSGNVYRGDLDKPEAELFIQGCCGAQGIKVAGEHVIVASGGSGNVSLYDLTTGAFEARWSNGQGFTGVNDIAIAPNGDAYITDSALPVLYRIPAAEIENPSAPEQDLPVFLEWTGTVFPYTEAFINANGIVATPDGRYLLVVNFTDGTLFRVRLSDKQVTQVDLRGYRLITGDGMVLTDDGILYVVRPFGSLVAKLRLNQQFNRGRLLSETSDPTFHGPTTAAIAGDRLLVVNSQFTGPPSAPPWTVSNIPLP